MQMLKTLFLQCFILTTLWFLCSCEPKKEELKSKQKPVIRVGIMDWPGFYPLLLALNDGAFQKASYQIEIIKGKDNFELNSFIESGKVDLCFGVFADHLLIRGNGRKIKYIYAADFSKSDVLVVDKKIKTFNDLIGKKISITDINSFSEFFILRMLDRKKIPESKVSFKVFPFDQVTEQLDNKTISAGHTWDPETATALGKGYKILANAYELKGMITDGLMATEEILQRQPESVSEILFMIDLYVADIKTLNTEQRSYLAHFFNTSIENIDSSIKTGVEFLNLEKNHELFKSESNEGLTYWTREISNFFNQRGQIRNKVTVTEILDPTFIKQALQKKKNR